MGGGERRQHEQGGDGGEIGGGIGQAEELTDEVFLRAAHITGHAPQQIDPDTHRPIMPTGAARHTPTGRGQSGRRQTAAIAGG